MTANYPNFQMPVDFDLPKNNESGIEQKKSPTKA